jgi:hypothetical protein
MLLIFPPVAKPCEPPAGIAKLAGALHGHGIPCQVLDANLEGLLFSMRQPKPATDTWTRRAIKNISLNIAALKDPQTYRSIDRYRRAVKDVNRVLEASAKEHDAILNLADFHHNQLSPIRSADLIRAAEHPEHNPFYPYFKSRLPEVLEESHLSQRRPSSLLRAGSEHNEKQEGETFGLENTSNIVGFSLNYLSQALTTFSMIGHIRKEFPGVKIILGGGLVSSWMKGPGWKNPFSGLVDHLVAGPGEGPLLDILGVKDREPGDSTPYYGSLPLHDYLSPGFILPYSGSSGCYWNRCSFCPETAEDNPYVPVPGERAMVDLNGLTSKLKPVLIHLLDNSVNPALMRALAERPVGVPWYGFARIDHDLADMDYCMALKRSGCAMLKLGLESGDQTVLDRMRKGIERETASQVLKNLRKAGIASYVYLLFGTPDETITEARRTLDFVVNHRDAITFLNLAIFNMPICSQEAGEYETGQFYEGDLSLYTGFKHPLGWDRKIVRQFLDNEFKKHGAVSQILRNEPPIFTSNHAAFFH